MDSIQALQERIESKKEQLSDYERVRDEFEEKRQTWFARKRELEQKKEQMLPNEYKREFSEIRERVYVYGCNVNSLENDVDMIKNNIASLEEELAKIKSRMNIRQ
jgi:chromosome segregation ATPase